MTRLWEIIKLIFRESPGLGALAISYQPLWEGVIAKGNP